MTQVSFKFVFTAMVGFPFILGFSGLSLNKKIKKHNLLNYQIISINISACCKSSMNVLKLYIFNGCAYFCEYHDR